MKFTETPLRGAWLIELERLEDERGWFARTFDRDSFRELGLEPTDVQCSVSVNARAGTLRGMHYQEDPHGEDKLVRCVRGAIFDAIVDLRRDSPTFCGWFGAELTPGNATQLLVPKGFAHGFQTLVDDAEVHYQMSYPFVPGSGRGVRWDDPSFGIEWPDPPPGGRIMSERDATYPDFEP
jgi:dTDP-4-dehydrorhamnose 3,5-epimerase